MSTRVLEMPLYNSMVEKLKDVKLSLSQLYPGSGVVLNCIDS